MLVVAGRPSSLHVQPVGLLDAPADGLGDDPGGNRVARHGLNVDAERAAGLDHCGLEALVVQRRADRARGRDLRILSHLRAAGLGALADLGFLGLDDDPDDPVVVTGFKATRARKLTTSEKEANRALAPHAPPVEQGFAHLKNWRILTKLRTDPARATGLLRVLFVLTNLEGAR